MGEKSLSGTQYFVTFIDDHSRKVWAFILKCKDQVLNTLRLSMFKLNVKLEGSSSVSKQIMVENTLSLLRHIARSMVSRLDGDAFQTTSI